VVRRRRRGRAVPADLSHGTGRTACELSLSDDGASEHAVGSGAELAGVDASLAMVSVPHNVCLRLTGRSVRRKLFLFLTSVHGGDHVSSCHHWADAEVGLTEILRVLAPGGCVSVNHLGEAARGDRIERRDQGGYAHDQRDAHPFPRYAMMRDLSLTGLPSPKADSRRCRPTPTYG
jgi:SAM-dependent methyltransferase